MPGSSSIHVRRATPADAPHIVRLTLEVQALHVAGRPDLFKPGGGESVAAVTDRISTPGLFYWIATWGDVVVGYAYARLVDEPENPWRLASRSLVLDQIAPFHERMAVELAAPPGEPR